jgi:hypothetical protein
MSLTAICVITCWRRRAKVHFGSATEDQGAAD